LDRRWFWTAQEKAALLAEVDAEGGEVRLVARRHNIFKRSGDISESLLYNWCPPRKAVAVVMGAAATVEFILAGIIEARVSRAMPAVVPAAPEREPELAPPVASGTEKIGAIESTLPNGTSLAVDASVNEKALGRVLRALQGLT